MQLLIDVVLLLLKALIIIGDVVLLLLTFLLKAFKTAFRAASKQISKTKQVIVFQKRRVKKQNLQIRKSFAKKLTGVKLPTVKLHTLKLPTIKLKAPKFPKADFRKIQTLLKTAFPEKKRPVGRPRKKIKEITLFPLPLFVKMKYFTYGFAVSLVFIFIPLLFIIFLGDLPNPKMLDIVQPQQTTRIFDRNGNLLFQIYAAQNRTTVPLSSIPLYLRQASIAIEDKNFYRNYGFDALAILRAAKANLSGQSLQGGSTITQQLVKSTLLTPEKSIKRKIKEIILAFWTERLYNKNQILEMYFNQVPYGGTAWGVQAASQTYFGKDVKDLTLAQSAFLAGLPKAPSIYSPYGQYSNLWKDRQKEVLQKMKELGYITEEQKKDALSEKLSFNAPQIPIQAPHFVMYIRDLLIKKYGIEMVEKGGLQVKTTLDLNIQNKAQDIVADEVGNNSSLGISNGATLVTNPKNGDILAMVGSADFADSNGGNVNLTTSLRQPGSSIKIVTYSAALSNGFTAATMLDDSPISFSSPGSSVYSPVNYDGRFHGRISLRIALANSLNVPAVKTLDRIGVATMVEFGKKMGITTWKSADNYGLSITLGAAEVKMVDMAVAYGTLANLGQRVDLNPILKITDSQDNLIEKKDVKKVDVLKPAVAYIMSNILADNAARAMEFGTNSPLNISNHTVSVKTGTSDNKRDNWTIGFTPSYLVEAWVGNNNNSPMSQDLASGITGAAPIWHRVMSLLLEKREDEKLAMPSDVVQKPCIGRVEYFVSGTENSINCTYIPQATSSAVLIPSQ